MDSSDPATLTPRSETRSTIGTLLRRKPRSRLIGALIAIGGSLALTGALLPIRPHLTPLGKGFFFLVVVVGAAAVGGLGAGILASFLAFLMFNFFFLPPYGTFAIGRGEFVFVLFVFLGLSVLISLLLARASERAEAAEGREVELRLLQEFSSSLVEMGPGPDTYRLLLAQLVTRFSFSAAALFVQDEGDGLGLREEVTVGAEAGTIQPRWDPASPERPPERLPLSVGARGVGLLVLIGDRPSLSSAESRVLRAISDQLALVLERDRLLRTATRAEVYRQSDHMRRSLLAAVSHDLRSPLAAIKTTATDLLDESVQRPDAERREALEAIDRSADRLNDLIANLLDMSRIELGVLKAKIAPVGIAEPLDAAIESIAPRWPSVEVRCEVADHVVRADPVFLDRVIANVLENAVKAAAEGDDRRIEITGERAGDRCVVRIADHGPGIPDPAKEGVFHPFYRLDERDPRLGPGLGLAIVKGFLSLMDGEVWIEDTPGGGATLAFSLLLADGTT